MDASPRLSVSAFSMILRSDLRHRWRAWFLLAVLLGVTAGGSMAAAMGARRTATTFDRFSDRTLAFDLSVQTADPVVSLAVDDAAEVVAVGRSYGLPFVFPSIDGKLPIMRARDAAIIAWDPVMGTEVDRPLILEGRALRPGRREVLINDAWAQSFDMGVGDEVLLASLDPHDIESPGPEGFSPQYERDPSRAVHVAVTVVGRAVLGVGELAEDDAGRAAYLVLDRSTQAELLRLDLSELERESPGMNPTLAVRLGQSADGDRLLDRMSAVSGYRAVSVGAEEIERNVARASRPYVVGLWLFAALALFATLAVVGPALARQAVADAAADKELVQLGASTRLLAAAAAGRAALIAVTAAGVATLLSFGLSGFFPIGPSDPAEPDPGPMLDVPVLGIGAAGLLVFVVIVGTVAARRRRSTPVAINASRGAERIAVRLPLSARMGVRRAFPPAGRSRVVMRSSFIALVVAIGATTAVTVFLAGVGRLLDHPSRYGWAWDAVVTCDQGWCGFLNDQLSTELRSVGGVDAWSFADFVTLPLADGELLPAIALQPGQGHLDGVTVTAGHPPRQADEIVLGEVTMRRLGVELGDFLAVGTENQDRFEVVGRAVFSGLGKAGRSHAELGEGAAILYDPWLALVASNDQIQPEQVSNAALVKLSTSTDVDALRAALPSFRVMAPTPPGVLRAWPQLRFMLRASLLLLGILAVATLLHALTLSARSHSQETAVLRALGLRSRTARMVTVWQAASLLATAGAAGAVLGALGGHVAWTLFADRLGIVSPIWLTPAEVGLPLISLLAAASLSVALALRAVPPSTESIPSREDGQYDEHPPGRLR